MLCPTAPESVCTSVSTSGDSVMTPAAVTCGVSNGTRTPQTVSPVIGVGAVAEAEQSTVHLLAERMAVP